MIRPLLITALCIVGCAPSEESGQGATNCASEMVVPCACPSGARGTQRCEEGRFSPCVCDDPGGPEDADPADAAPSDAEPLVDAQKDAGPAPDLDAAPPRDGALAPDAAPPPPEPVVCDDLDVVDFFTNATGIDGRWELTLENPPTTPLTVAECGGGEDGVIVGIRAPYDGYWLLYTGGSRTDFDPVVRSYTACPADEVAEVCVDDDDAFAPVLGGYLAAGDVRYFAVTAWSGVVGTLDLVVERLSLVSAGGDCTGSVACTADTTCVPRLGMPEASVCEPRTPPELETATARRYTADVYTLVLEGRDASRDVWGLAIQYLDDTETPIMLEGRTTFYAPADAPPRQAPFRMAFRFGGLSDIPGVTQLRVAAVDDTGAESAYLVTPFSEMEEVGADAPCDPLRVTDICPNSFTCHLLDGRCGPAQSPVITDGAFYLNREEATWGLVLEGTDRNADLTAVRFLVLDRRRRRIELDGADTGDLVMGDGLTREDNTWRFVHSGNLPRSVDPADVGYLQLIVVDREGLTSEDEVFSVAEAPVRAQGEPCDSRLARDACVRGTRCQINAAGDAACRPPVFACPPGVVLPELSVGDAVTGNTYGTTISAGHLTCSDGLVGLRAYRFVAPEAGTYVINTDAAFEAITYVTRSCVGVRYVDELGCTVGGEALTTVELQMGQEVYVRIGGVFARRDEDEAAYKVSRGRYQLTIERQP